MYLQFYKLKGTKIYCHECTAKNSSNRSSTKLCKSFWRNFSTYFGFLFFPHCKTFTITAVTWKIFSEINLHYELFHQCIAKNHSMKLIQDWQNFIFNSDFLVIRNWYIMWKNHVLQRTTLLTTDLLDNDLHLTGE